MSTRAFWIYCVAILAAFVIMIVLTGCGEVDQEDERHFERCLESGGSYQEGSGSNWECDLPDTVTVTPSPSPYE